MPATAGPARRQRRPGGPPSRRDCGRRGRGGPGRRPAARRSSRRPASACGTYSSVSVKPGSATTSAGWAWVTFSNRSTAMPAVARPQARSFSGLLRPMISSGSCGPEPESRRTAGRCFSWPVVPRGTLRMPVTASGGSPRVTSVSVNAAGSAYGGGSHGAVGSAAPAGRNWMPVLQCCSPARSMAMVSSPRSKVTGTLAVVRPGPPASVSGVRTSVTGPYGATSASHAARRLPTMSRSGGANRSQSSANCPFLAMSITASAAPAGSVLIGGGLPSKVRPICSQ